VTVCYDAPWLFSNLALSPCTSLLLSPNRRLRASPPCHAPSLPAAPPPAAASSAAATWGSHLSGDPFPLPGSLSAAVFASAASGAACPLPEPPSAVPVGPSATSATGTSPVSSLFYSSFPAEACSPARHPSPLSPPIDVSPCASATAIPAVFPAMPLPGPAPDVGMTGAPQSPQTEEATASPTLSVSLPLPPSLPALPKGTAAAPSASLPEASSSTSAGEAPLLVAPSDLGVGLVAFRAPSAQSCAGSILSAASRMSRRSCGPSSPAWSGLEGDWLEDDEEEDVEAGYFDEFDLPAAAQMDQLPVAVPAAWRTQRGRHGARRKKKHRTRKRR